MELMRKYRLKQESIRWPKKCAVCLAPTDKTIETSCTVIVVNDYAFYAELAYWYLRRRIRYPVCARHRLISQIAGTISRRNLFNLALGAIVAFAAISLVIVVYNWIFCSAKLDALAALIMTFIVSFAIGDFIIARRLTPVKLNSADEKEKTITLSISNHQYAKEFERLNATLILPTLPWWRNFFHIGKV